MLKSDVVLITAFGRGRWLLNELARAGMSVQVLDLSELVGGLGADDAEGPFGIFKSERISETQLDILFDDTQELPIPQGLSIWSKKGVLELKGPLTQHQMKNLNVSPEAQDFLARAEMDPKSERLGSLKEKLLLQGFESSWLAHLACQASSLYDDEYPRGLEIGLPLPVFAPYSRRAPKVYDSKRTRQTCEKLGHYYRRVQKINGLRHQGKNLLGLELQTHAESGERHEIIEGDQIVSMLSRAEWHNLNRELDQKLFTYEYSEPLWAWLRFGVRIQAHPLTTTMPLQTWMIEDLFQIWAHENFLILNRDREGKSLDIWMKVAHHRAFDKKYLALMMELLEARLKNKIPGLKVEDRVLPHTFFAESEQTMLVPYVVYAPEMRTRLSACEYRNFISAGLESCEGLEWNSFFERQNVVVRDVITQFVTKQKFLDSEVSEVTP